jgi:hypothetical protein
LLHVNKESDGERNSHESINFEFEVSDPDRICNKSFIEMISTSRKYYLLHEEHNLEFKWRNK